CQPRHRGREPPGRRARGFAGRAGGREVRDAPRAWRRCRRADRRRRASRRRPDRRREPGHDGCAPRPRQRAEQGVAPQPVQPADPRHDEEVTTQRGRVRTEPSAKRVRAFVDGVAIADTTHPVLVWEKPQYPAFYFPVTDVRTDLLVPTGTITHS